MTLTQKLLPGRRTLSAALFLLATSLVALVFTPFGSLLALDGKQRGEGGAISVPSVAGEAPHVAGFRQAQGGAITPLIIELKAEPSVLRKVAADQQGKPLAMEELVSYATDLVAEQKAFFAQLGERGVRAVMHEKDVTQLDGSVRHIEYRFTYLLNGFIAYVATEDIAKLKAQPEVAHVSEPEQYDYQLNRAVDYSLGTQTTPADRRTAVYGANQEFQPAGSPGHPETPKTTKLDGFEGQGINIAIIDSGVDYRHPMFGGIGLTTAFPRVSGRPESADDNKKVIYFYAFNEPIGDPTDDFGHGTLVASNAAGYSVDGKTPPRTGYGTGFDGRGVGPTPNGDQLFGTAPQARILAYKVCGPAPNCVGDIPLSIEDAASPFTLVSSGTTAPTPVAKPVADVINLSLGSTNGDAASATSRACNNAALAGVVVVASAGNSGAPGAVGDATIGAPAAATLAIAVAASLDPGSIAGADVLAPGQIPLETRTPATPGPSPEKGATSIANTPQPGERQGIRAFPVAGGGPLPAERTPGEPALTTGSLSAHYVFVDRRDPATPIPSSVTNRIAVVKGAAGTPFTSNANPVAALNPAAILLVTSVESATAVVVVGGIPTFTINPNDTDYLLDLLAEGDDDTKDPANGAISRLPLRLDENPTDEEFQGAMAGFSSRGPNDHPNAGFRNVKPDVSGPGVGIVGAATVEGIPDETVGLASTTGYTVANGTSFSGPVTAGGMVLVRQRVREELNLDTTDLKDPEYRTKRFDTVTVARALMQNNATNLRNGFGVPQGDGAASVASVNQMGSGYINVAGALQAKAIMVSPTLLLPDADPNNSGNQAEFSQRAGPSPTPFPVLIPTGSFATVPVIGLQGTLERRKEVIIRDVTNGQGGGTYNLTVQDSRRADTPGFDIGFVDVNGTPITSVSVPAGGQRSFFVRTVADGRQIAADRSCTVPGAAADAPPTCADFQWYVTASDAAGKSLRMPFYYRAVQAGPNEIPPLAAQLQNISTRLNVQTGDNVGIGGFIVTGNDPKRVLIRGIGPSLTGDGQPLNGRLQDPVVELFDQNGVLITANDNWKDSPQRADIEGSGIAPQDDRESAIAVTLAPGQYTAVMSGKDNTTGIALVEAYDRDQTGAGKFANISTRGFVQTGDNVLIGGFIVGRQTGPTNVVIRAIGPSLTARGVPQAMQDPTVELFNQNGDPINQNDDFATSQQRSEIESRGLAPEDARESALFQNVTPGNYTAIVRGKADTTGVGLVEVYNVQ